MGFAATIYVFRTQSEIAALRRQIQLTTARGANKLEKTPDEAITCMAENCRGEVTELLRHWTQGDERALEDPTT